MPRKKTEKYNIVLETAGVLYESEGNTLEEALANLPIEWIKIKMKSILKISKGNKSYEHLFNIARMRSILVNKLSREIWAKRLEEFLESEKDKQSILE